MHPSGSSVSQERTFTVRRTEGTSTEEAFSSGWGNLRQEAGFQNLIVASKRVEGPKKTPESRTCRMASPHEKSRRKRMSTSSTKRWAGHINVELWQLTQERTDDSSRVAISIVLFSFLSPSCLPGDQKKPENSHYHLQTTCRWICKPSLCRKGWKLSAVSVEMFIVKRDSFYNCKWLKRHETSRNIWEAHD